MIDIPADADTDGLHVTLDGVEVDKAKLADPQLVDPGPKQVEYPLGKGPKKTKIVPVERGGTSEITLDLPKARRRPRRKSSRSPISRRESSGRDGCETRPPGRSASRAS